MLHTVRCVEYVNMYRLKLSFNDGKVKIVDFENRLKEAKNMFLPLRDIEYFKKVKADGTTIIWPNGLDLCPDVLYEIGKEVKETATKTPRRRKSKTLSESLQSKVSIVAKSRH